MQLENLRRKLQGNRRVTLRHEDSGSLTCASRSYDCVVVFFLLHEQPESARVRTVHEALRAVSRAEKSFSSTITALGCSTRFVTASMPFSSSHIKSCVV